MKIYRLLCSAAVLLSLISLCHAQTADPQSAQPLWEAGIAAGVVSQQAYPGSDQQIKRTLVLPYVAYRGQYLRADREGVQVRGYKSDVLELDLSFAASLGSNSSDIVARQGMPNLGTLFEVGPRANINLGNGPLGGRWKLDIPLRGVFDLSNSLAYQGLIFEPKITLFGITSGGLGYGLSASAAVGNRKLTDHFYGVAPIYANASRAAYEAKPGLVSTRLELGLTQRLSDNWRLFGFARLDNVALAANSNSPLVKQTTGTSVGMGLVYTFYRSDSRAAK